MTATAAIYRTRVHTRAATNAFQRIPKVRFSKTCGPAVVEENYVHLLTLTWTPEVTRICCYWLTRRAPRQEAKENTEVSPSRNDFLYSHAGNVYICKLDAEVSVTFIGTHDYFSRLRYGKVHSGNSNFASEKMLTEVMARCLC